MRAIRICTSCLVSLVISLLPASIIAQSQGKSIVEPETSRGARLPPKVIFADGMMSVTAKDAQLSELLEEIARQTGLIVVYFATLDEPVSFDLQRVTLEQALRRVLHNRSFALQFAPPNPGPASPAAMQAETLWIFARSEGHEADAKLLSPTVIRHDSRDKEAELAHMGELGGKEALVSLSTALSDSRADMRIAAIDALADVGGSEAARILAIALQDPHPAVREAAVDALGEIGGPPAIDLLQQALWDEAASVREAVLEVLEDF